MKVATILDMPKILEILEINGEEHHLEAIRKRCTHLYLSDSGDSFVSVYEGQPTVHHIHINAKPRKGMEAIKLLEEAMTHLFEKEGATLILGLTPSNRKGWRRFIGGREGDKVNYIDLQDGTRMYYFTIQDYINRGKYNGI
jgi:hypothetical protein